MKSRGPIVRILGWTSLLAAFAVASYLTVEVESGGGCRAGAGCSEVLSSRFSRFAGVPVGFLGVGTYGLLLLAGALAIRGPAVAPAVRAAEDAGFVLAIGAAIWFSAVQAFFVRAFCPLCLAAHALAATGVLLSRAARPRTGGRANVSNLAYGLPIAGIAALAAFQTFGPEPERVRSVSAPGVLAAAVNGDRGRHPDGGAVALDPESLPAIGNPGTLGAVAVTDWTCPHCLELHRVLESIVGADASGVGVVLVPGFRTPEARELHRVLLTVFRADRALYSQLSGAILSGELEPAAAAVLSRARRSMTEDFYERAWAEAPWVEETLRSGERLLAENDSRLESASLPQLMIGDRILSGSPRRETVVELLAAFSGQPIRIEGGAAPEASGGFEFASRILDFGQVGKGESPLGRFEFRNGSAEPVTITRIKPSCGCTAVEGWRQTLAPGATGHFEVRLDTRWLRGGVSKPIDVETSATRVPTRLHVRATVFSPVEVTPSTVTLAEVSGAPVEPKRFEIVVTDASPLSIREVRTTNPHFRAELVEVEPGRRYEVIVAASEDAVAPQQGELVIPLGHPRLEEERVPLYRSRIEALGVSPASILRSAVPAAERTRHMISVTSNDPRVPSLEISDLEFSFGEGVRIDSMEGLGPSSRRIVVTLPAEFDAAAAQAADAHLSFATNVPDAPRVRVPVRLVETRRE